MSRRPRIGVSLPAARLVRFFLDTDYFDSLARQSVDIVLIHRLPTLTAIIGGRGNVSEARPPDPKEVKGLRRDLQKFCGVPDLLRRLSPNGFLGIAQYFFFASGGTRLRLALRSIRVLATMSVCSALLALPVLGRWLRRRIFRDPSTEAFLRDLQLDGLILACPNWNIERTLAEAARRLGIPVALSTDGWDTLTTCGGFDHSAPVVVWGPAMARHARDAGFRPDRILEAGMPHASRLRAAIRKADRDTTRAALGIAPSDRVVTMFASSRYLLGDLERVSVQAIVEAVESGRLENVKLVIRLFPRQEPGPEEEEYLRLYANHPVVRLQVPSRAFVETATDGQAPGAFDEVGALLAVTDVLATHFSMSLLEAAVAGVPGILVAYDGIRYPTRFVTRSGLVKDIAACLFNPIVRSPDELIAALKRAFRERPGTQRLLADWDSATVEPGPALLAALAQVRSST